MLTERPVEEMEPESPVQVLPARVTTIPVSPVEASPATPPSGAPVPASPAAATRVPKPRTDDSPSYDLPPANPHDSARLLLGLLTLHQRAESANDSLPATDSLAGIISKGVLRSLMSALYFRDVATVQHSRRVAMLATGIAKHLGWETGQIRMLEVASLLHDVGKIGVPDNILFKPGKLSPDEIELMSLHHNIGVDVLQACRVNNEVVKFIVQAAHHYHGVIGGSRPLGAEVCLGARMLAVADAYDSLSTDKSYRQAQSHSEIMVMLKEASGSQFDGNIVRALERWSENEALPTSESFDETSPAFSFGKPSAPDSTQEAGILGHIFAYLYLLESLYDGFYLVDSDLRFVLWNRGAEKMLARNAYDILGQPWTTYLMGYAYRCGEYVSEQDAPMRRVIETGKPSTQNVQIQSADGRWIDVEMQSVPVIDDDGQLQGVAEIFRDLSRNSLRPREYRDLKLAASRDSLTSLVNRRELESQLDSMLQDQRTTSAEPFCVIFSDIDHFKSINDTWGHAVGDQVLVDVARCLQHESSAGDMVARYGGEEFVIVCPTTELEQGTRRAERLRLAIVNGNIGGVDNLRVAASFGVTQVEKGDSLDDVIRRADQALYSAKKTGRNRTVAMTSADAAAEETAEEEVREESGGAFYFETTFRACVAADMIVYKLGGFVRDEHGALTDVTPTKVTIQLGRRNLVPFWGRSPAWQPVKIVVESAGENRAPQRKRPAASRQVLFKVRIEPLGWVRNPDTFRQRANSVVRTLRSYFAAE